MGSVYVIQNLVNGKNYVGQTVKRSVRQRYGSPNNPRIEKERRPLDNALLKYGPQSFAFTDLMVNVPKNELDFWEKFWISTFRTCDRSLGYNLESGGNKGKVQSPETVEKRARHFRGRKPSPEILARLRSYAESQRGKPGHKLTPEQRARKTPDLHPDYVKRHWYHPVYGEYYGGVNEMVRAFPEQKLSIGNLSMVARQLYGRRSEKGWRPFDVATQQKTLNI